MSSVYERALQDAREACASNPEKYEHVVERYACAVEREHELRREWVELGRPKVTMGGATGKAEVVHPLLAKIESAEAHAQRLATDLGLLPGSRKGVMGRPQEQVVPKGAGEPPRLAAVK